MNKIRKVLVANRSEIAVRIIRAAHEMGLRTVAVFSDADRLLPHVRMADESFSLGSSEPAQSYLNIPKILNIAKQSKADAIHPGYGFLSENPHFAEAVLRAGLIFIGPRPDNIRLMGDKLRSKKMAREAGVPIIPGFDQPIQSAKDLQPIAKKLGYPVLIKATAGGGGKGMRIVRNEKELSENIDRARSEARNAFDSDMVFLEKYIENPRHIEIQVLGDGYGNHIHLYERDCSIQRRHQKLLEESPSPALDHAARERMVSSALAIAKSCNYLGAGTVEFVVDQNLNHYFLEMNTRLQVEHPVTELITGIDLVKEQIRIAAGDKLSFRQENISQNGHAIELRVYAENVFEDFLPSNGYLDTYIPPKGPGIRIDDGYEEHLAIPIHYDALISKLLVHGRTRNEAISILQRAVEEYQIGPIPTTLDFGKVLCRNQSFQSGKYDTSFIEKEWSELRKNDYSQRDAEIAAALASFIQTEKKPVVDDPGNFKKSGAWKQNRT